MNAVAFRRDLLEMQSELQRFAFKLTADKEEANDLLQETSLRALENMEKYSFNSFKPNLTLKQIRERFEKGKIPKRKSKFKQYTIFDYMDE